MRFVLLLVNVFRRVSAIRDVHAEPLGLQASAEVPIFFSFTTGENVAYGQADADQGDVKMILWLQFTVACRPELEPCTYVELGENNNCEKVLEAPELPLLRQCILAPRGVMILELRGTLQGNTEYSLLVLGTLPPAGKRIQSVEVKVKEPNAFLDVSQLVSYEEASVRFTPEYITRAPSTKQVTALQLVSPSVAGQGVNLQQYIFRVVGSEVSFEAGDQLRIFSSPFIYPDEGLSFGGSCDGFDVSGFVNPLRDCTCEVASIPAGDARVGYNVVVLTFGDLSTLSEVPEYFRIKLNTPKHMGSFGLWFAASKDVHEAGVADPQFTKVIPAIAPFFVVPSMDVFPFMPSTATPVYGASQRLDITIFPRLNLLGNTLSPAKLIINSPAFHQITICRVDAPTPEAALLGTDTDSYCLLTFKDKMNMYVHQSVYVMLEVVNPNFAIGVESFRITVESGDGTMSASATFLGWPVYTSLKHAFLVPLTMAYAQWNELEVIFSPASTSPQEPRAVIVAPHGFLFEQPCGFEIKLGFPLEGVQCSNPSSEMGLDLFSLRMPMTTVFEAGATYAVNIYPLRNPFPGSYSGLLDTLPWRIDLVTMDGSQVLETLRDVPMGPELRGFPVYPHAIFDPVVIPSVRTPRVETKVAIQFRVGARVSTPGERLLITAPYGYKWKVGAPMSLNMMEAPITLATLSYSEAYPPVAPPHNQIELSLVNPDVRSGSDLTVNGVIRNAPVDPLLNTERRSANVWVIEMYEPGAGYLEFDFRHQAVVFMGYLLQAITGSSVEAWLPFASPTQTPIMVTFRLGTALVGEQGVQPMLELEGPQGIVFPFDCAAQRISPVHLPIVGYTSLPMGSIATCRGGGGDQGNPNERLAQIIFAAGTFLADRVLFAFMLEVMIPDAIAYDNTWNIRSFIGPDLVEEESQIPGFRLATPFLSALYHPGTDDTGEDLRVGAQDNRVMLSVQPAAAMRAGGTLRITAPYRFTFARECASTLAGAKDILGELVNAGVDKLYNQYHDLPPVATCRGEYNVARLTFTEDLDVAIRHSFRIGVANPLLPHPSDWPLSQNIWRVETFDPVGAPLNVAELKAFFLWAFAWAIVYPLVVGAGERTILTIELEPSLTVPPRGSILVTAPVGYTITVPCEEFQRDTFSEAEGFQPLPSTTTCSRGPGNVNNVVRLQLDSASYLAATRRFRFRLGVVNPAAPSTDRREGPRWSILSAEVTEHGEAYLEQNTAVEGYAVHERLKAFDVFPDMLVAEQKSRVTFEVAIHDSLGTFEVITTTEVSFLVIDMPLYFSVPVTGPGVDAPTADGGMLHRCAEFSSIYPEQDYFPAPPGGCLVAPGASTFRLRLVRNLIVGPDYEFMVGVLNPTLDSLRQRQLALVNKWQARLVRVIDRMDVTYTSRSVSGYRVLPFLQDCTISTLVDKLSVNTRVLATAKFGVLTALSAATHDALHIVPPPSIYSVSGAAGSDAQCDLRYGGTQQSAHNFECRKVGASLAVHLRGNAVIDEETEVRIDFEINTGNQSLRIEDLNNTWTIMSVGANSSVKDQAIGIEGFMVFASLHGTALLPGDVSAMSYTNHAEFRFQVPNDVMAGSSFVIMAPTGFVLYPRTFRKGNLAVDNTTASQASATQGSVLSEAIVTLRQPLAQFAAYFFYLTIGNPAVSPPTNEWALEIRNPSNETTNIDPRIHGFAVISSFNTSLIEAELDEPLAENYLHIMVAVSQPLLADSVLERSSCVPTDEKPICPPRTGLETFIVITAPDGFSFQPTCGYWALSRVGSKYEGLPPGSLCRADPINPNVANVQVSLSLEPLRIYEFTVQVRNAISAPLENYWRIHAVQDGVVRERNSRVEGFPLRELRGLQLNPSTPIARAVDNTVTVQMRSERPVTTGSIIRILAPIGFRFDETQVSSSFQHPLTAQLQDSTTAAGVRFQLDQRDFVAPNVYFFISIQVQNPSRTPIPNFWYFYITSQFLEHIDLRKYFPGFVIAHSMLYCQAFPNTIPWSLGTSSDVSMLFVTQYPLFTQSEALTRLGLGLEDREPSWKLVLVAPLGFTFPTENKYTNRCLGFRRWGGKETYDQLPEIRGQLLTCVVRTSRSVLISVPTISINETRYSFRINVTAAAAREDVAFQDPWKLTVLEGGEILHLGSSPSPLLGAYYEPEWFFAGDVEAPPAASASV